LIIKLLVETQSTLAEIGGGGQPTAQLLELQPARSGAGIIAQKGGGKLPCFGHHTFKKTMQLNSYVIQASC
jgi:hypothetical protein